MFAGSLKRERQIINKQRKIFEPFKWAFSKTVHGDCTNMNIC